MELIITTVQDIGQRTYNQDYYLYDNYNNAHFFAVADGCGAYAGSDLAAKSLCESLLIEFKKNNKEIQQQPRQAVDKMLENSAKIMVEEITTHKFPTACTTITLCIVSETKTIFAHVGDSRIYTVNENGKIWHTKDHSYVQELIDAGEITAIEAKTHPLNNVLTKVIGEGPPVKSTIKIGSKLQLNSCILLATDGFWHNLTNDYLRQLATEQNPQHLLNDYIKQLKNTEQDVDNATAILIQLQST